MLTCDCTKLNVELKKPMCTKSLKCATMYILQSGTVHSAVYMLSEHCTVAQLRSWWDMGGQGTATWSLGLNSCSCLTLPVTMWGSPHRYALAKQWVCNAFRMMTTMVAMNGAFFFWDTPDQFAHNTVLNTRKFLKSVIFSFKTGERCSSGVIPNDFRRWLGCAREGRRGWWWNRREMAIIAAELGHGFDLPVLPVQVKTLTRTD